MAARTSSSLLPSVVGDNVWLWRAAGGAAWTLWDASTWSPVHYGLWLLVIVAAMELLARLVRGVGDACGCGRPEVAIPQRGKPLAAFAGIDTACVTFNKLATAVFTYHMLRYAWLAEGSVVWDPAGATVWNCVGILVPIFVVYDLGYAVFHRILHLRALYPYIHKHHHRQTAPFRGNVDAINVHPFEFLVGEYNHLATVHLVTTAASAAAAAGYLPAAITRGGHPGIHAAALLAFILVGGVLASLNHTRFDVTLRIPGVCTLYSVKYHDLHHWSPTWNYGQYTMLWDAVMGTFRPYPDDDATARAAESKGVLLRADDELEAELAEAAAATAGSTKQGKAL